MKRAIVSGANGFVGSAVIRELLAHDIEVVALVRNQHADRLQKEGHIQLLDFELSDAMKVKDSLPFCGADVFFHFAWDGSAGNARSDVDKQLGNVKNSVECVKLAKELGCKRFVSAGSIMEKETYDATWYPQNKPGLGYIYGGGKLTAHIMCKAIAADIGIEYVSGVITNAYGVGEKSPRMVNTTIQKCIRGESPKFTAGTQKYDFVYIDDVARAFRLIAEKGNAFEDYLIGSSNAKPLKEFLLEMQQAIAPDLEFVFGDVPFTGVDLPLEAFDCSKTEADTGFRASISFAEGCKKTRDWWLTL